ncbi:UDP-glucose 4-epimerase [Cohnella sp. OV330]|uniref:UDP-glucose 4-epimerase GalE n=1 Tax=Cohnella sp. OV330 TaxID=1855288 RepID=UPI0008F07115|nr:UDP-glucose 4-epimerase GalE [Cohnella sp. OV330]SFB47568.1 UDP-glucose 4-epimerase [Cohnella sp. OV330]
MAILVAGGAGYIGSHTCVELLNEGYDVVVVDNLSNSSEESLSRVRQITGREVAFYNMDLLDREQLEKVFETHAIEAVVHFAGSKAVGESVAIPLKYYENNMISTINLCQVMQKYDVKRLVFSSSATVYAPTEAGAISEDFPLAASNPYGRSKWMIEEMLRDLYISDPAWSIALLRYFNPVGAHPSGLIGEHPNGKPNNLTPYITQVAVGKLDKLYVFGDDYPTHDGTGVRDYIHVMDLANGHLKAIERVMSTTGAEAYNLGTGRGYSVLEMIHAFRSETGRDIPYTVVDRRPGDIAVCYADPSKARDKLGWLATRGIEEMCADAWRWQSQNPNGYEKSEQEKMQLI